MKQYGEISSDLLKSLPHPGGATELKIKVPEFTFLGVKEQPDFASVFLTMYPRDMVIELRSLKEYVFQWRDVVVSYERAIEIFYQHLMEVYRPHRLRIVMICNPRGGISSKLTIDSDWAARGGPERFADWKGQLEDTW
jgi:7-cyano-7-deazaguanine reductase